MKSWIKEQDLAATIITIGTFMGILLVPLTLACYLIALMRKKTLTAIVPLWLIISNILHLIFLLLYIISLNARPYPQT